MKPESREEAILARVREELVAEGYEVIVQPNRLSVPSFLGTFSPDAVAFGKEKNIVVEVASQNPRTEKRLAHLRELVEREPSWELRLIWTSAGNAPRALPEADLEALQTTLLEIEKVLSLGQPRAALLLAWGCLEALARRLVPKEFSKPQTPGRIVEKLALEGYLTPSEAEQLRELARRRNRLLHGDLRTEVRRRHVAEMLFLLNRLMKSALVDA